MQVENDFNASVGETGTEVSEWTRFSQQETNGYTEVYFRVAWVNDPFYLLDLTQESVHVPGFMLASLEKDTVCAGICKMTNFKA